MKILILFSLTAFCFANITKIYKGTANDKKGNLVYYESHNVTFNNKKNVLKSVSDYLDSKGKKLGTLTSEYQKSLTCPEHTFVNHRDNSNHGVRLDGDTITLFMKEKGEKEKTKSFSFKQFDKSALVVGSQGLHYYLVKNLNKISKKKELPLKFLIPGKLDYYSFYLTTEKETDSYIDFKVRIDNFFLNLFTPSLEMRYDKNTRNLISYSGLSNLPDKNGDMQNVSITFKY